eukprot:TRINITY_DN13355_c0_g1_i1.p1 TRINITY_DN13355_c0_g1~~TRINITY_DN13355_c0_g1_i1.p1  ORF type:complete len:458 (-),score=104.72 TRINITY_DN13355_c0_g1_i1:29-1402(-)
MQEYYCAGSIQEWDKKSSKLVTLPTGAEVNVVKDPKTGEFLAIDNNCSHKKGNLSIGDIEDIPDLSEGLCVRCPKHQRKFCGGLYFDLHTGKALTKAPTPHLDESWVLSTFSVKTEGDQVMVSMEPSNGVPPLSPRKKIAITTPLQLKKVTVHNHNSNIYEFQLVDMDFTEKKDKKIRKFFIKSFVKPKVAHLLWHVPMSGDPSKPNNGITREYTPLSSWEDFAQTHTLKLLIKLYPDGLMSQQLAEAKIGDFFWFGPPQKTADVPLWPEEQKKKKHHHEKHGKHEKHNKGEPKTEEPKTEELQTEEPKTEEPKTEEAAKNEVKAPLPKYGFIAGGSGIAPVYQLISHIIELHGRGVAPHLTLLFSNRMHKDVLLAQELKEIAEKYPENFDFHFTLTGEKVDGLSYGRIDEEMITRIFPRNKIDHVFVSGPAGMWESALSLLQATGYSESDCTELEA